MIRDGLRFAADPQSATEDGWAATKEALPCAPGENDLPVLPALSFLRRKRATQEGRHSQHGEEIWRDSQPFRHLGVIHPR